MDIRDHIARRLGKTTFPNTKLSPTPIKEGARFTNGGVAAATPPTGADARQDAEGAASATRLPRTTSACVSTLSTHPSWRDVIAYNEFSQEIVFVRKPPFDGEERTGSRVRPEDITRIVVWFEDNCKTTFGRDLVLDALQLVARKNTIHPVRKYLDSLKWDGKTRVGTFLEGCFKVAPHSDDHRRLVSSVGMRWLISCVARAYRPGCQVDSVLILEGAQGIGKSTGLESLAGKEFFRDSALNIGNKDVYQNIQGVWIYELAELDALIRAEASETKAFLSSRRDRFRPPYGRLPEDVPRGVVFCGTVNHGNYLKDQTGNRRFWTVRCTQRIDREGITASRDQLWAEAVVLYKKGEQWHLTEEEEALMHREQEERVAQDPFEQPIVDWLARKFQDPAGEETTKTNADEPFSVDMIFRQALGIEPAKQHAGLTKRIAEVLESLGFERKRETLGGHRQYVYRRTK